MIYYIYTIPKKGPALLEPCLSIDTCFNLSSVHQNNVTPIGAPMLQFKQIATIMLPLRGFAVHYSKAITRIIHHSLSVYVLSCL